MITELEDIKMTCKELTQAYIEAGQDSMSAWWWARNPSNPDSPAYSKTAQEKCDRFMTELTK
jgi:hypothetical protein